jgi:PAS domain S-box-containing protein
MAKSNPLWWPKPPVILSYGIAVLSVTAALIIARWMEIVLQSGPEVSLFICAVMLSAWFGGVRPGLLAIALSVLAFDYYFVPPINSLALKMNELPRLLIFVLSALLVGSLSAAQRSTAESLKHARDDLHGTVEELKRTNEALQAENTERQQAEEALRQAEEKYRGIFEHAIEGIFQTTLTGKIVVANPAMARMLGYESPTELMTTLSDIRTQLYVEPEHRSEFKRLLEEEGSIQKFEAEVYRKDGSRIWTSTNARAARDRDGQIRYYEGTTEDIAERKQAEEALRERASLLDLTHDTVFVRDMHDVITYWNRGAEELYGWTSTEAIGRVTHQLTQTIFPAPLEAINEELLRAGRWEGELIHTRRDGTPVVVASRWALQLDEWGNPIAILETNNNITERKQAEEALRKHREQLEEQVAARTRELSTLLETSNTIASTLELQPLLRVALDQLKVLVRYTGATILLQEGEDLIVLGHSGPLSTEQVAQVRLPVAHAVGYQAIHRRGGPVIIDDVQSDSPEARAYRELAQPTLYAIFAYARSVLLAPLIVRERLIGIVRIDSDQPHFYSERDAQLALAFANQAAAAIENARLYDQARDLATIEERQRLARELHDAVTQTLFSASLIAEALPDAWRQSPEKAQRGVEELRRLTRGALAEMRTLLLELLPAALAEKPLGELLRSLCTAVMSRTRIPIELTVAGDALLVPSVQIALYRVTQEALNNIAKHAAASQVTITGQCDPERVELRITDNGRGFDPSAVAPGSLGLGIMRERATSIGATLRVVSRPGAGTELCMIWQDGLATRAHGGAG